MQEIDTISPVANSRKESLGDGDRERRTRISVRGNGSRRHGV
jgi:hypothetical protein